MLFVEFKFQKVRATARGHDAIFLFQNPMSLALNYLLCDVSHSSENFPLSKPIIAFTWKAHFDWMSESDQNQSNHRGQSEERKTS